MAEIQSLLDGVIEEEITNVKSLEAGTEKKSAAIRDLATLHKLRIEEIKAQTEADEKAARREMDKNRQSDEHALKERELNSKDVDRTHDEQVQDRQIREQVIDRRVRTCLQVGELVLPLVCYGIWFGMGLTFEIDNSYTSTTFKNLLNRFKPTKRG